MFFIQEAAPGLGPGHDADGFAVGAAEEGESIFAVVQMDQVAFAKGAASQRLDRVNRSHIGFNDGYHLLIGGVRPNVAQGDFSRANAHRQAGAHMAVKVGHVLDGLLIDH
jgi:hypothetical protein